MSYDLQRECAICNSPITDENPDGIGYTCRHVWRQARVSAYYKFHGLELWSKKCTIAINILEGITKGVKFRSKFKLEFIPSVIKQWKEKGRLSKKQLDLVVGIIQQRPSYSKFENWHELGGGGMLPSCTEHGAKWWEESYADPGVPFDLLTKTTVREWQPTDEERKYIMACARKGYAEARSNG